MIKDFDQELTLAGGHDLAFATGDEYGSRPYDKGLAAAGVNDPAVGEPLHVMCELVESFIETNAVTVALVADTDGAGAGEVVLASRVFADGELDEATEETVYRVGTVSPGDIGATAKRYLTAKISTNGTTPTTGLMKVWLQKGTDVTPANAANSL